MTADERAALLAKTIVELREELVTVKGERDALGARVGALEAVERAARNVPQYMRCDRYEMQCEEHELETCSPPLYLDEEWPPACAACVSYRALVTVLAHPALTKEVTFT